MKRILVVLVAMVIGASASGCAGKRYYPVDSGGKRHYPATTVKTQKEVDPKVVIAYEVGRQMYRDKQSWDAQCAALRAGAPVFTPTCREILGDDRDIFRKYRGVLRDLNGY